MSEQSSPLSVHIPVAFVALTLSVFFMSQIGAANQSDSTIRFQKENLEKLSQQLQDSEKQLTELVEKRKDLVAQSQKVQEQYTAILNDVLELSKTDADAADVVAKWKIQKNASAEAAEDKEKKDE